MNIYGSRNVLLSAFCPQCYISVVPAGGEGAESRKSVCSAENVYVNLP